MIRILHMIETSGPGGAENVMISLVRHLPKDIYQSQVCLLSDGWLKDELNRYGVETIVVPQQGTLDIRWIRSVVRIVKERQIQVMHAHEFAMNVYGSIVSMLTGVPIVATVHGKNYYVEKAYRRLAYRWVSRMGQMTVVSEDIRGFLVEQIGASPGRVAMIHNGIDIKKYDRVSVVTDTIRKTLGLDARDFVVGTIGNLYPVKGHINLILAAEDLAKEIKNLRIVIAGRGELLASLRHECENRGLGDRVMFLGYRNDVNDILRAFDVFVLPSLSEGLPLSLLEAMVAKRPVIATSVGGIPEIIADGESGFLVNAGDRQALAEKIRFLWSHPTDAKRLAETGYQNVKMNFSVEHMMGSYMDLYRSALS